MWDVLRLLSDLAPVATVIVNESGRIVVANDHVRGVFGYDREELIQKPIDDLIPGAFDALTSRPDATHRHDLNGLTKNGVEVTLEINVNRLRTTKGTFLAVSIVDITERNRAEDQNRLLNDLLEAHLAEQIELQEQLRQSQKLESIGRLAGGVAHDFNNMLTAINGYSDLALRRLDADDPTRKFVQEVRRAGERSAMLTNQLLAFSRRQILQPQVIKINDAIVETSGMLERLIGEDVDLVVKLRPTAGSIRFDPGQLSQILINLAVNARDAMPDGGKLSIETDNIFIEPEFARSHIGVLPGAYVMLAVSDSGIGMTPEVQERIYEPFFTTKGVGKGTGLGLATVYGIVKQSGGGIFVYSEPDHGTSFKIYIPRVVPQNAPHRLIESSPRLALGTETILLVEDEEQVRALSRQVLESCGYRVIEATDGFSALDLLEMSRMNVDLLITDLTMPRMGGRELAEKLRKLLPELPILFSSGYTDEAVVRHGLLETNVHFIQKPFSLNDLARKVRDVLDERMLKLPRGSIFDIEGANDTL